MSIRPRGVTLTPAETAPRGTGGIHTQSFIHRPETVYTHTQPRGKRARGETPASAEVRASVDPWTAPTLMAHFQRRPQQIHQTTARSSRSAAQACAEPLISIISHLHEAEGSRSVRPGLMPYTAEIGFRTGPIEREAA